MIFLTYSDTYSGIYKSQVIDVCRYFSDELSVPTRLIALVSIRHYRQQRALIRRAYANSLVLPMVPKARFWRSNTHLLYLACLFSGQKKIWARGAFACNMALSLKERGVIRQVIFDARGAYQAELTEYEVVKDEAVIKSIAAIERRALTGSDAQLAVSQKLADWWKTQYAFTPEKYRVVPCTLGQDHLQPFPDEERLRAHRAALGFSEKDIVLVYSGSSAGWQSFAMVDEVLCPLLEHNPDIKILFLSDRPPLGSRTFEDFAGRVISKWVKPQEVRSLLLAADHGILVREQSVTNQVASPVKFAEYLACGLQVLISEGIGDFSELVRSKGCGSLYPDSEPLQRVPYAKKITNHKLALQYFSKHSPEVRSAYTTLLGL